MRDEKRKQNTQIRASIKASIEIRKIAEQLWEIYADDMRMVGLNRPSSRMAIDYLLVVAASNGEMRIGELNPKNNMFLRIAKDGV